MHNLFTSQSSCADSRVLTLIEALHGDLIELKIAFVCCILYKLHTLKLERIQFMFRIYL